MPHTKPLHQQRSRKVLLALVYAGIGTTIVGLIVTVIGIFGLVDAIRETQKDTNGISKVLLDCTDPEGECSEENQKKIAGAVNNIGRLSVYASACAADVDPELPVRKRVAVIEKCVRELAQQPPAQTTAVD